MKRFILLGIVAALAIVMLLPVAVWATGGESVNRDCDDDNNGRLTASEKEYCDDDGDGKPDDRDRDCDDDNNGRLTASEKEYCDDDNSN